MSVDIANQMLNALIGDGHGNNEFQPRVIDQKQYLIANIRQLTLDQRRELGNILVRHNRSHALKECAEGSVVNLDLQPDDIISAMYDYMRHQISKAE